MKEREFIRGAGILLSVTSLPSEYGIGTLGDAAFDFIDLLVDLRQRYWQVLPLGPTSYGDSPYQSLSAFAGNPYLIDLNILLKEKLITQKQIKSFHWGENEKDIDYGQLFTSRFLILNEAFLNFNQDGKRFLEFCEEEKEWLDDYALFMSLKAHFNNRAWTEWDTEIRDRTEESIKFYQKQLKKDISFWKFCQYKFFEQWENVRKYATRKGIQIIGDIPLYIALDSVEVWVDRQQFELKENGMPERVAGCPPDAFSDEGQIWGNPLYNWNYMEKTDFAWWKRRMKASARLYDIIRIDHFIGIVKYYSIPTEESNGKNGKWVKGPGKKLTDAIESAIGAGKIIAEDLGVFIPGVKRLIKKIKWPGMKILQFAFDGNTAHEYLPHNYENGNMVVYGGTHDNETIEGYFQNKTEYELAFLYEYLNISKKEQITDAIIRLAYSSIANVVIFQMQDILKLDNESRMNLPATIGKNWRWRIWRDCLDEKRRTVIRTMSMIYRR